MLKKIEGVNQVSQEWGTKACVAPKTTLLHPMNHGLGDCIRISTAYQRDKLRGGQFDQNAYGFGRVQKCVTSKNNLKSPLSFNWALDEKISGLKKPLFMWI